MLDEQVNPEQVETVTADALFKEQNHTNGLFFSNNMNSAASIEQRQTDGSTR